MLKLMPGVHLVVQIEQTGRGFTLVIGRRVGNQPVKAISTKALESEEALWIAIIRWAESRLAQLGIEKTT